MEGLRISKSIVNQKNYLIQKRRSVLKSFAIFLFRLIQSSKHCNLKKEIENFAFELLIELPSTIASIKHFQIALMDLVYLTIVKQEMQPVASNTTSDERVYLQRTKLPEDMQNLWIAIDSLNAFTDQTKQKVLPQAFFSQLEDVSNDGVKLKEDDFEKCNKYFDRNADEQLIRFMNNSPLLENSFASFISSFSDESNPNSTHYQSYPALSNIPIDCIQLRSEFIYQLNILVAKILPMIDLNLNLGQSFLADQVRTAKVYLLREKKVQLLEESLEKTLTYDNSRPDVMFDTIKASESKNNIKNTMFYQAYQQLSANAHKTFRKDEERLWSATYVGMHSIDQGGPYRDSITQICSDICSTRLPLFILCPNGQNNQGTNRDCWIPNVFPPNESIPDEMKKQYRFVGQLIGMAIRKKHYLDLKFPHLLWKQLLYEPITIEDIQTIDIQSFTGINEIEKNIEGIKSMDANSEINDLFSNILNELRFDVVSSAGQTYELIPGGMNIPITAQNFKRYSSCYRQYRLNEFQRQIDCIRQGLYSIVPSYFLSLFTPEELEEVVCGKNQVDMELLKRNTNYDGCYDEDSPHIQRFWTVLSEMFNNEQKKLFLTFVWGRNTLPRKDEDFMMRFTINEYDIDNENIDKTLPRKFNLIVRIVTFLVDIM